MPDHDNFEPRLADAFRRYANHAPTDVDAMALAREIASGSAEERRRHPRWWPFGKQERAHEQGRSRTMFMAAATAAIAAITLGAGYALVGQSDEITDQRPAISSEAVGDDWAFFSGTLRLDGSAVESNQDVGDPEVVNGLVVLPSSGWEGQTLTTSDPRMTGSRTEFSNMFQDFAGANGHPGSIWANAATIEAEGGSWSCQLEGVSTDGLGAEAGWCHGENGFDGLRSFVVFDHHDAGPDDPVDVWGYITAAEGPPLPEAAAE